VLPKEFKPKASYELIRLGKDNDGGYLVELNSIKQSKSLIAMGMGRDCSFENDFMTIQNSIIHAYDYTVTPVFWLKYFIRRILAIFIGRIYEPYQGLKNYFNYKSFFKDHAIFFKEKIGSGENNTTSISDAFNRLGEEQFPVFLKIDIEGSEYEILEELISLTQKISGMVIEFHQTDKKRDLIKSFIEDVDLELTHIHPNNNRVDANGDPLALEMTFSRQPNKLSDTVTFPHSLDQRNVPRKNEISLNFLTE